MRAGILIGGIVLLVIGVYLFLTAQQTIVSGFGYSVAQTNSTQQTFGGALAVIGLIVTVVGAAAEGD
ncbi:MAG: hypothetical protein QW179_01240 [Candidatus Hadarchaeales archaeon]